MVGLVALATAATIAASPATCGRLLPPTSGAYFAASPNFNPPDATTEDAVTAERVAEFERLAGRKLVWAAFSQYWFKSRAFPRASVQTLWRAGRVPYVWMLAMSGVPLGLGPPQRNPDAQFSPAHILAGDLDADIRAWARDARETNIPIVVEYGTEVNNDWGPWNGRWSGGAETAGYGDPTYPDGPERFRDAYRRLVTLFRDEGAVNVTWAFHVDAWPTYEAWNAVELYYPGDDYIDWVGISNYGALDPRGPLLQFADKLDVSGMYDRLRRISARPFAVIETGTVEVAGGKPQWIRETFDALRTRYPAIRAISWFSMNQVGIDTRIESSPESLAAFRAGVADPYFASRPVFSGRCAPATPAGLTATTGTSTRVRVRWSEVPNASYYAVWRSGRRIATTRTTQFDDTTAVRNRRYVYSVRALNVAGRSSLSRAVAGLRR